MTRIVVAGAAGRMGRMILAAAAETAGCRVTGAFDIRGNASLGQDAGMQAGAAPLSVKVTDDASPLLKDADVLIDFTVPDAVERHAALCAAAGVAMVIGTTGVPAEQRAAVEAASRRVPVVFSPNMSVGVNVVFRLISEAARLLGPGFDLEIVEAHHNKKKDAPSGTAVRMLEVLAAARGVDPAKNAVHGREGLVGPRERDEIGVHAVRAGDIAGDHTVLFAGPAERVEIVHRAHSREVFARGAVRAASWVAGKPAGLYGMDDVLGLK